MGDKGRLGAWQRQSNRLMTDTSGSPQLIRSGDSGNIRQAGELFAQREGCQWYANALGIAGITHYEFGRL